MSTVCIVLFSSFPRGPQKGPQGYEATKTVMLGHLGGAGTTGMDSMSMDLEKKLHEDFLR